MPEIADHPGPPRRIVVVGITGSGKTMLASRAAAIIGGPHVELDALYHEAGWVPAAPQVFRDRVRAAIADQARWVTDGGYRTLVWDITWPIADEVVWLDYAFPLTFWRVLRRTLRRRLRNEELWNGNRESLRSMLFSGDSLLLFAIRNRGKYRESYPEAFRAPHVAHVPVSRLRSPREAEAWLRKLAAEWQHAAQVPG
jgi:adenylate kinase family enzyme